MKLTQGDKALFVKQVMHALPKVDYEELACKLITEDLHAILPKELAEMLIKHEDLIAYEQHVYHGLYLMVPYNNNVLVPKQIMAKIQRMGDLKRKQDQHHGLLQRTLEQSLRTVSTWAGVRKRWPAFERYLPEPMAVAATEKKASEKNVGEVDVVKMFKAAGFKE